MNEMIYKPLIHDMTWSYSRIKTFSDCPYKFFLKYIHQYTEEEMFYASYGKFVHKLIERHYKSGIPKEQMKKEFILNFSSEVKGKRPSESIVCNYFKSGLDYFESFNEFNLETIGVEKKVNFTIDGYNFTGFIDYIGRDKDDIIIIDNKSRNLKSRSGRIKPTQKDLELDDMLIQLYLYSVPVINDFGTYPKKLCFNCFRNNTLVEEVFDCNKYINALEWAKQLINNIEETNVFYPSVDYFRCNYLCGLNNQCEYYSMSFR